MQKLCINLNHLITLRYLPKYGGLDKIDLNYVKGTNFYSVVGMKAIKVALYTCKAMIVKS